MTNVSFFECRATKMRQLAHPKSNLRPNVIENRNKSRPARKMNDKMNDKTSDKTTFMRA